MKKNLLAVWFCCCAVAAGAQFTTADAALDKRLQTYLALNKALDFEKMIDYMHPSLFAIAPREAILKLFEQTFKMEEMTFSFDSLRYLNASAPFTHGGTQYRKVDYYSRMRVRFSDTALYAEDGFRELIIASIGKTMPDKKVVFDEENRNFAVSGTEVLFAIKDAGSPDWMFLGFKDNPELIKRLYPKEVIAHFKL